MAIRSLNSAATPMPLSGSALQLGNYVNSPYQPVYYGSGYTTTNTALHRTGSITSANQVVGLVPLFPCESTECRLGKYGSNDTEFMLPAFAENQVSAWGNYKNDYNTWLFNFPATSALATFDFFLDKKVNGVWVEQAELNDDQYGFYYPVGKICNKNYFTGFNLLWNLVLNKKGEGVYRFRTSSSTGSFVESTNHFKIVGLKPNATIELFSGGFGLICPTFTINDALSFNDNRTFLSSALVRYLNNVRLLIKSTLTESICCRWLILV